MGKAKSDVAIADVVERVELDKLVPQAKNARLHSKKQIGQIARSIAEFGFLVPVLIGAGNEIIAGHGRVLAARQLRMQSVPCVRAEHLSDVQRRAYAIADNQLTLNASWDDDLLRSEIAALADIGLDISVLGFEPGDLDGDEDDAVYTHKIVAPVYEPRGERPEVSTLYSNSKARELEAEIAAVEMPDDVRRFLIAGAQRHTTFHFERIAEYYCHAPPEVQRLIEHSAMVVIDYGAAIEAGFVRLANALLRESGEEDEDAD